MRRRLMLVGLSAVVILGAVSSQMAGAQTPRSVLTTGRAPASAPAAATGVAPVAPPAAEVAHASSRADDQKIEVRHADKVEYDGAAHLVVMTGSVHIVRGAMSIKADRVDIKLADDEKTVQTATATGHVEVVDGTRRAVANRAVYTESSTEINLTGSPKLWDGGNEIEAERIIYNLNSRTMHAEGGVRGFFLPGGFATR